jgi:hypothetical protein
MTVKHAVVKYRILTENESTLFFFSLNAIFLSRQLFKNNKIYSLK